MGFFTGKIQWISRHKIAAIVLLLLAFWGAYFVWPGSQDALLYTVKKGELVLSVPMDGELKAVESYIVKAPANVWGNIRIVKLVPEGTRVKKGDFLIQFDTSEQLQRLQEVKNSLETALATLASTKADIENQMAELESNIKIERYNLEQARLRAKNAVYEAVNKRREIELSLKKAELNYQRLIEKKKSLEQINAAKLRKAQLEVERARIKVKQAEDDLKNLTITSPASGLVVYEKVWDSSGMIKLKVGYSPWRSQSLIEIPSQSKMKVSGAIDEIEISKIKKGLPAEIRLDAIKDSVYTGRVTEIATLAHKEDQTGKNVFDVEILIDQEDSRLKPGMTAHCEIIVDRLENVLTIPIDAVELKDGKSIVHKANGSAVIIETGLSNDDFVEVKHGLVEGDKIQLRPLGRRPEKTSKKKKPKPKKKTQRVIIIG
jgi:multidrug efflux pump subunit AcrA (membrane-fusion protein)